MTKQEKAENQEKPTEETVEETPKKETPFEPVMEADEVEETTEAQAPVEEADDKLAELQKKYDAMEDSFLRSQAEIKNIQMRNQKEQANLLKYDGQSLAKDVLPVLDNLERALAAEATDESLKTVSYTHL
ncbi:nucleotide exchange factor GrpE, partial [Latilactobacillus sakei]|uniref:nucleotide exchange factor GrpE n=1 Tax=Latilactobacillus sakei TaxID=1599 RepID=UPI000C17829A